jgi:hypothetical protein
LRFLAELKGERVRFSLDQLVSEGKFLTPEAWIDGMDKRWGMSFEEAQRHLKHSRLQKELHIQVTDEEIEKGTAILDGIAAAGEKIRAFLEEKTKLEDLL